MTRMPTRKRLAGLVLAGTLVAAVVTLAAGAYASGWAATSRLLQEVAFAAETKTWPMLSRAGLFLAPGPSAAEREVWRFLIAEYARGPRRRVLPIAVNPVAEWPKEDREPPAEVARRILDGWPPQTGCPAAATALQDFLLKSTRSARVDVALPAGSRFIPIEAFRRTWNDRFGWETFTGANSVDAYLTMSRVGFNLLGTRAVVYVDFSCGPLCGHGEYYILEKRGGSWVLMNDYVRWVS